MKIIIKFLLLLTLSSSLFTSCSPERRLHRLIKKYPHLSKIDTIKINDTTITNAIEFDTILHYKTLTDTFKITKEELKIQILQKNDTIYLNTEVKPDTIILTKQIPIEKIIHVKPKSFLEKIGNTYLNDWRAYFFLILILVIVIYRLIKE